MPVELTIVMPEGAAQRLRDYTDNLNQKRLEAEPCDLLTVEQVAAHLLQVACSASILTMPINGNPPAGGA